jgi:hypothetical protein
MSIIQGTCTVLGLGFHIWRSAVYHFAQRCNVTPQCLPNSNGFLRLLPHLISPRVLPGTLLPVGTNPYITADYGMSRQASRRHPPMNNVTSTDALTPDKSTRLRESLDLFGSTTVSSALYAIVLMFYCLSFHHFYRRIRDTHYRRSAIFSLVHASLVTLWSTVFLALTTWSMHDIYLDHATYPGGPYQYEVGIFSQQVISPLTSTSSFMLGILTLGIQVSRYVNRSLIVCWFSAIGLACMGHMEFDTL